MLHLVHNFVNDEEDAILCHHGIVAPPPALSLKGQDQQARATRNLYAAGVGLGIGAVIFLLWFFWQEALHFVNRLAAFWVPGSMLEGYKDTEKATVAKQPSTNTGKAHAAQEAVRREAPRSTRDFAFIGKPQIHA
mmetsp:Transcript_22391/g.56585  ORF Transcript_22391/g.56585 Transcript_22391/m.56585 type:complete len:135 (+) Transcript_22391:1476-1880(+)